MSWIKNLRFCALILVSVFIAFKANADASWERGTTLFVQSSLTQLGYKPGPRDGVWGKKTANALKQLCLENELACNFTEKTIVEELNEFLKEDHLDTVISKQEAVWFENRIGFGAPNERVERYIGKTRREAIDLIIAELKGHRDQYVAPGWVTGRLPLGGLIGESETLCNEKYIKSSLINSWIKSATISNVPQYDRLSTFFLDHFSVAYDDYEHPHSFAKHIEFVRSWRDGNFLNLLEKALSDPSTLVYLNNDQSTKSAPNENLAREFLELFSLGEGNYSENDIRSLALLLSGHGFNVAEEAYKYYPQHSFSGSVEIFNKRVSSLKEFLNLLKRQKAFSEYIIKKLYNEYVSLGSIEAPVLRKLAYEFSDADYSLIKLFEAILKNKVFWDQSSQLSLIKSPLEAIVGTSRTLNSYGKGLSERSYLQTTDAMLRDLGQNFLDPPSIDGWPTGTEWLSGQKIDLRSAYLKELFIFEKSIKTKKNFRGAKFAWKNLRYNALYQEELKKFFVNKNKDQLAIEHIAVPWVSDEFNRGDFGFILVLFHNLEINNKKIPQIEMHMKREKTKNLLQFRKHTVAENFMSNSNFGGNGNELWHSIRLPLSYKNDSFAKLSETDRKLIKGLILALSPLVDGYDNKIFREEIDRNTDAKKWLNARIEEHGGIVDVHGEAASVKLFAARGRFDGIKQYNLVYFNCNHGLGDKDKIIEEYFSPDGFGPLGKQQPNSIDLSLLLPFKEAQLNGIQIEDILSSVEYNLK